MLSLTDIKLGKKIVLEGDPFLVLFSQHSKMGRAGAVMRTKLKNLKTGATISKTFQGNDKFEEANLETKKAQYLYQEGSTFFFMDNDNYDQFELPEKVIGDNAQFLVDGSEIDILYFNSEPINIELPIKMDFEVTEAPPAVKGNTADGGSKQVTIETGAKISVPLFVKTGDRIRINTQSREYAERAK